MGVFCKVKCYRNLGSRGIEEAALDIALFVDILAENESLDACENFSDFRICGICDDAA